MHSDPSNATPDSPIPTIGTPAEWLPTAYWLSCSAVLTVAFTYYGGIPGVSYEVASSVVVGAWCVGLRSLFRRLRPDTRDVVAPPNVPLPIPQPETEVASEPHEPRASAGRVVAIADGPRRAREKDDDHMREAV